MRKTLKSSRKNVSRKNKKTKKDGKNYSRKNKINKMKGGTYWEKKCIICLGKFLWPKKETLVFSEAQKKLFDESDSKSNSKSNSKSSKSGSNNSDNNGDNNGDIKPVSLYSNLVGELPCGHIFHKQCIINWYESGRELRPGQSYSGLPRNKCPFCNMTFNLKDILNVGRQPIILDKDFFTDLFDKLDVLDMNNFVRDNVKNKIKLNKEIFNAMSEALKDNKTIKKITITQNPFMSGKHEYFPSNRDYFELSTKDFSKFIFEILKFNDTIIDANIINFKTFDEGAFAMADGLEINTTLEKLYFTSNNIIGKGAKALAEALKKNNSLTYLGLFNNVIGDEGAKALAEALKTNTSLTILDINRNEIGDEGGSALAEALKTNTSLKKLDISDNEIGDVGGSALAEALKGNKSLEELNLRGNRDRKFRGINYEILSSDKRIKSTW